MKKIFTVAVVLFMMGTAAIAQNKFGYMNSLELLSLMPEVKSADTLIDKYAKTEPEISYGYFDGNYLSYYWSSDKGSIEFWFRTGGLEMMAYRDDDSEWMEIDDFYGRGRGSCIERFGKREYIENIIKEEHIKEAFGWLYE